MMKLLKTPAQDVSYAVLGEMRLPDRTPVYLSLLSHCSKAEICEGFRGLSKNSRYLRFHSPVRRLTDAQLIHLTDIDSVNRAIVAAHIDEGDHQRGVGLARYARLEERSTAEFAVTVLDAYQGKGIGSSLLEHLRHVAFGNGIDILQGFVLRNNYLMIHILEGLNASRRLEADGSLRYDLETSPPDLLPS